MDNRKGYEKSIRDRSESWDMFEVFMDAIEGGDGNSRNLTEQRPALINPAEHTAVRSARADTRRSYPLGTQNSDCAMSACADAARSTPTTISQGHGPDFLYRPQHAAV